MVIKSAVVKRMIQLLRCFLIKHEESSENMFAFVCFTLIY